ncbi:hypothetical protein ACS0TY_033129 [Phlomoides rotata]
MTTNFSEAINGVLKGTQRLPITAIKLGMKHTVDLYNHSRRITKVTTHVQGMMHYRTFRVSLSERECDCGQWKLDGIPCSHALEVCRQYTVDPTGFVLECYSKNEYALTYSLGFFTPLSDVEEWDEPNFQLRHNLDRRIKRHGRDVTSRIHNEMDWAQTRAR